MLSHVTDVTDATFATAVIERSMTVPVVVDLWADWCGPCKTLGPIIEKVIDETNGAVELAKVDVGESPGVTGLRCPIDPRGVRDLAWQDRGHLRGRPT